MKKVISIISILALLLSLFTVFAFAETDAAEDELSNNVDYSVLDRDTVLSDAKNAGFNDFIDVDEYYDKAGETGYDSVMLIGISEPIFSEFDYSDTDGTYTAWSIGFYFYNPQLLAFAFSELSNTIAAGVSITPTINGVEQAIVYSPLSNGRYAEFVENDYVYNQMFICGYARGSFDETVLIENASFTIESVGINLHPEDFDFTTGPSPSYDFNLGEGYVLEVQDVSNFIDYSSPLQDLSVFLNLSISELKEEFPQNFNEKHIRYAEPSLAFVYEDRDSECLYLYVYDEHGLGASSERAALTYCDISLEGLGVNTKRVQSLEFVSSSDCFLKFRISNLDLYFDDTFSGDSSSYYITGFRYFDSEGNVRYFNSKAEFSCIVSYDGDEVYVEFLANYITLSEVKPTYYRLDNSGTGMGYYQTLSSVYFSVPREYFELDDEDSYNDRWVERISGEYTEYYTNIGIVTSDKELETKLIENPSMKDDFYLTAGYVNSAESPTGGFLEFRTAIGDIPDFLINRPGFDFKCHKYFETYGYLYSIDEMPENMDTVVSSEEFLADIKSAEKPFAEMGKYVPFDLDRKESFELVSNKDWTFDKLASETSFFTAIGAIIFGYNEEIEDSIKNIKVFETLSGEGLEYCISYLESATDEQKISFCKNYFTNMKDIPDVLAAMKKARDNNDVFIFLRFDVYDYYCDFVDENTFVFQEKYYENFDILEIELANQYDSKLYLTRMIPINFVADITSPSTDPIVPGIDINWPDWRWPKFEGPDFSGFFTVMMIIAGVILFLFVGVPLLKKIFSTKKKE